LSFCLHSGPRAEAPRTKLMSCVVPSALHFLSCYMWHGVLGTFCFLPSGFISNWFAVRKVLLCTVTYAMLSVMDVWVIVGTMTRDCRAVCRFGRLRPAGVACDKQVWGQLLGQAASACQKLLLEISELGTKRP
jgi:hypothetical protein